jgi:hypothetical protein
MTPLPLATLSTVGVINLALAAGALAAPVQAQSFAGPFSIYGEVPGVPDARNTTLTATFTDPGLAVVGLRLSATVTSAPGVPSSDVVLLVTGPGMTEPAEVRLAPPAFESLSGVTLSRVVALPVAQSGIAGTWTVRLVDDFVDSTTAEHTLTGVSVALESAAPTLPTGVSALGSLLAPGVLSATANYAAGQGRWYSVQTGAVTASGGTALEITTSGALDAFVAAYDAQGVLVAADDENGVGSGAMLSFGAGTGSTLGDATDVEPRSLGQGGDLAAGTLYVFVAPAVPQLDRNFVVQPGWFGEGSCTLTVRLVAGGVAPAPTATSLGVVGTSVLSSSASVASGQVRWWSFVTTVLASDATNRALEIDTRGSSLPATLNTGANDTVLALYRADGRLAGANDDADFAEDVVISALSFGDRTPVRPSAGDGLPPGNGRDGELPAGTYYAAVAAYPAQPINGRFAVIGGTGTAVGSVTLNLRPTQSGPAPCGPSDVAGAGQTIGADGALTADDIIVFIGWFFAQDARADVAGAGQVAGADGDFSADDIIVFIGLFFGGC